MFALCLKGISLHFFSGGVKISIMKIDGNLIIPEHVTSSPESCVDAVDALTNHQMIYINLKSLVCAPHL